MIKKRCIDENVRYLSVPETLYYTESLQVNKE